MLDIIVTHYKEPWEIGKKFFDMLDLQRAINFADIKVIIVNDGEEYRLPDEYFANRPYRVEQYCIKHAGVSAARNEGLRRATEEWVAFNDFDDMYAHPYSLKSVLDVLPAPQFDMLWGDLLCEEIDDKGNRIVFKRDDLNTVFCHSKFYRRQALLDNELYFDTNLRFNEDSEFNSILMLVFDYKRTGKINTTMPIYAWIRTDGSVTHSPNSYIDSRVGMYWRDKKVVEAVRKHDTLERYYAMVARVCIDAYYTLNCPVHPKEYKPLMEDFVPYYLEHKDEMWKTDKELLKKIKQVSYADYSPGATDRDPGQNVDESISVTQWLRKIEQEANSNGGI